MPMFADAHISSLGYPWCISFVSSEFFKHVLLQSFIRSPKKQFYWFENPQNRLFSSHLFFRHVDSSSRKIKSKFVFINQLHPFGLFCRSKVKDQLTLYEDSFQILERKFKKSDLRSVFTSTKNCR